MHDTLALASDVARRVIARNAPRLDATGEFPTENFAELGKVGLMGILVPRAYGGLEANYQDFVLAAEVLGKACPSTALLYVMHTSQYVMVVDHGTDQQRAFFLPDVAQGKSFFGSGTTEREVGGNAQVCVSAKSQDGESIVLDVEKPVVSAAANADWVGLTTRAHSDAPGNLLSLVIAPGPKRDSRVETFGEWDCVGMRATGSIGLRYRKVTVPSWHQVGPEDSHAVRVSSFVPVAVIGYCAVWLGIAQSALDAAIEHLKSRRLQVEGAGDSGKSLADFETVQWQIAEARTRIETGRAAVLLTARLLDEARAKGPLSGLPEHVLPIMWSARIAASETAIDTVRVALRVCGVNGLRKGYLPLERLMRDALTSQVMAPGEDRSKLILGKFLTTQKR